MPDTMTGTRVEWTSQILNPGEYAKLPDGTWHAATPNGHMANLSAHHVVEHEDGTITVAPSILVSKMGGGITDAGIRVTEPISRVELWHGFLERGVWRAC